VIPRYQKIIFLVLLLASLAMGAILWHLRDRAHQRLVAGQDSAPTRAPQVAPAEQATLLVANDADGSLLTEVQSLPLPADPSARARAVLGRLLDLYAASGATHPVPGGASSIAQVFLMPAGDEGQSASASARAEPSATAPGSSSSASKGPELAVVNLASTFAASHPSGIETETLTVLSICGTLRANLPRVTEVRFLIDGQQRPTLAGHADLTRTYLATEAVPSGEIHP
jgi:hypothetical protein